MNSSKRSLAVGAVVVIIIIVVIAVIARSGTTPSASAPVTDVSAPTSVANGMNPVAVSETTKVSGSLSQYLNAELGFSVHYPSTWEKEETNAGVTFIVPIDPSQVSSVATLQGNIQVLSGTCAFPPVTTVQDRGTISIGTLSLNTISMSNSVQGRSYFNRMYSLQQGDVCYMFSFASITLDPASKGFTGPNVTQAQNNNKAIVDNTDAAFTSMVRSFAFVVAPQGEQETQASPATPAQK